MNNTQLQNVVTNGMIFLDARYLDDFNVSEFLTTFTLKLNKLGVKIKIGLIIPLEHSEDKYQKIILDYDDKEFDLSYFFYIHSKVNYKTVTSDYLKVIFEKNTQILFITQDQSIAFDVATISNESNQIFVRRVSVNSLLESYPMIIGDKFDNRPLFSYIHGRSPRIDKIPLECYIPKMNEKITINGKEYTLREKIGETVDGVIYALTDEIVVKIYKSDALTKTRVEKISTMVKRRVTDYGICWPLSEVMNCDNETIGFTMKRCYGKPISSLYRGPIITQQNYPNYTAESSANICIKVLKKIQKLHKNNVLIGDINDKNFIINKLEEVFLIDTDNYQLEDYSCDFGTIGYTAPELKDGMLSSSTRSFEDEGYSIAVFVFRTLMQGYFPFAQIGSDEDYTELIKKQEFPYHINNKKTKKHVPLLAYESWENFSPLLVKMFITTFVLDKKTNIVNRFSVEQWIIAIENYLDLQTSDEI